MTLRTAKPRRNPVARIAGLALAIGAAIVVSGFAAAPARADGAFERAFEAELGRIAARGIAHVGHQVLHLGNIDFRWHSLHHGYRGASHYERRFREHRHHAHQRHHGAYCRRHHRGARAEYRDRHDRRERRR